MALVNYDIRYPYGLNGQDLVGYGITALVARLDAVIKFAAQPSKLQFIEREKRVYQRLGHDHDGVVRYYGSLEDALILQYACNGSIRQYFARQTKPVPLSLRLRWIEQITTSIAFIHSRNVMHGDISCNNVFLDKELNAKLGDFAGSLIDDEAPLICYETSHEHPDNEGVSTKSEVFALGSTFYEVMTGSKPYGKLSDQAICDAYAQGNFPSLAPLAAFRDIIAKCWDQSYASVDELLENVKAEGMSFISLLCLFSTNNLLVAAKSRHVARIQPSIIPQNTTIPIALALISLLPIAFWARNRR